MAAQRVHLLTQSLILRLLIAQTDLQLFVLALMLQSCSFISVLPEFRFVGTAGSTEGLLTQPGKFATLRRRLAGIDLLTVAILRCACSLVNLRSQSRVLRLLLLQRRFQLISFALVGNARRLHLHRQICTVTTITGSRRRLVVEARLQLAQFGQRINLAQRFFIDSGAQHTILFAQTGKLSRVATAATGFEFFYLLTLFVEFAPTRLGSLCVASIGILQLLPQSSEFCGFFARTRGACRHDTGHQPVGSRGAAQAAAIGCLIGQRQQLTYFSLQLVDLMVLFLQQRLVFGLLLVVGQITTFLRCTQCVVVFAQFVVVGFGSTQLFLVLPAKLVLALAQTTKVSLFLPGFILNPPLRCALAYFHGRVEIHSLPSV